MSGLLFQIIIFVLLFSIGWGFGRRVERQHFQHLAQQEQLLLDIQIDTNKFVVCDTQGSMISSNVVISHDYFKYVLATIQNFFGGRLTSYESVVERARREAIIRLKQQAKNIGAKRITGLRLSTTELGMQGGMVEVFAYGTAVF